MHTQITIMMPTFLLGSGAEHSGSTLSLWNECADGTFQFMKTVCPSFNASATWFLQSKCGRFLYSVGENNHTVSSFRIIRNESQQFVDLELVSTTSSHGVHPCHLNELADGSGLLVANYTSGNFALISINTENGVLSDALCVIDHNESSEGNTAHAHQVVVSPFHPEIVYVCDLGTDHVFTYSISSVSNKKTLTLIGEQELPTGSGPRHLVINSKGTTAFVVSELGNTVCALPINPVSHCITASSSSSSHGKGKDVILSSLFPEENHNNGKLEHMGAAEILLSANDKYLYISNRDIDPETESVPSKERSSISVFSVENGEKSDRNNGLSLIQNVSSRGRHPRYMCFTNNGSRLLVANRLTHSIVSFTVDQVTGMIEEQSGMATDCRKHCAEPCFILKIEN
jgi:6-phosphogluconolactonase